MGSQDERELDRASYRYSFDDDDLVESSTDHARRRAHGQQRRERQMALQLGALREALIDAGASPDKAFQAAEEIAAYDSDIKLLTWMVGRRLRRADRHGAPTLRLLLRVAAKVAALDERALAPRQAPRRDPRTTEAEQAKLQQSTSPHALSKRERDQLVELMRR